MAASPADFSSTAVMKSASCCGRAPFLVETRFQEFVIGHDILDGDGRADLGEDSAGREGVELAVRVDIELLVVRLDDTRIVVNVPDLSGCIREVQPRREATDEPGGLREHVPPP